jgi:hypothetical protein
MIGEDRTSLEQDGMVTAKYVDDKSQIRRNIFSSIVSNMPMQTQIMLTHCKELLQRNSYCLRITTKRNILKCRSTQRKSYYQYLDSIGRYLDLIRRNSSIDGTSCTNTMRWILSQQKQRYEIGVY